MKYLIVVAHPDDEVLGAGATIHNLVNSGNEVSTCIFTCSSHTRENDLENGVYKSNKILGIDGTTVGDWEAETLKDIDHKDLMRFLEGTIELYKPDIIITHYPGDLHQDHRVVSKICQEASRISQRKSVKYKNVEEIKGLFFMEVQSSTDWWLDKTIEPFIPDTFKEVYEEDIKAKVAALNVYEYVLRDYPHPRSIEGINALVMYRGTQCGKNYAEAFETVFRIKE